MKNLKYYDENSDDAYDAMKDEGYPMNDEQRRDADDWNEECRQNGW